MKSVCCAHEEVQKRKKDVFAVFAHFNSHEWERISGIRILYRAISIILCAIVSWRLLLHEVNAWKRVPCATDPHIYYLEALVVRLLYAQLRRRRRHLHEIFGNDASHQLQCLMGFVVFSSSLFLRLCAYLVSKKDFAAQQTVANNRQRRVSRIKKLEKIKINTQNNNVQLKLADADSTSALLHSKHRFELSQRPNVFFFSPFPLALILLRSPYSRHQFIVCIFIRTLLCGAMTFGVCVCVWPRSKDIFVHINALLQCESANVRSSVFWNSKAESLKSGISGSGGGGGEWYEK